MFDIIFLYLYSQIFICLRTFVIMFDCIIDIMFFLKKSIYKSSSYLEYHSITRVSFIKIWENIMQTMEICLNIKINSVETLLLEQSHE